MNRPAMAALQRRVSALCAARGVRAPSRATLYNTMARLDGHSYDIGSLPAPVIDTLYNLAPGGTIPGRQLAFYCFNYGPVAAVSFAAGLPWLDLYQAGRLRGWRPRSRGLLAAVARVRGIR
jgi:hypothetical protein